MTALRSYYFGLLVLLLHAQCRLALQCYECNGMNFNMSLTSDNIPSPTAPDCEIVSAQSTCSVRIGWYKGNKTEVYYGADTPLPIDSVMIKTERKVTAWSGEYETRRFIIYNCKASNSTPCNTVENAKRAIKSTTFPTDEQIDKLDSLIVPTTDFDGRMCLNFTNASDCRETNIVACQQCIGIVQYFETPDVCATCPAGKAIMNFFDYESTFFLTNRTYFDVIRLGCRKYGVCNSIENMDRIKNTLSTNFDFKKFYYSTASLTKSNVIVFISIFLLRLFS
ncbi:unnamed protein product [Adineta ricciae]|uniref:Uncharacterized protein n=1 Tax=Adineta ricciae TaxID=249248 RepID=A0A814Q474_ADIRI|nr:unnamed protein product [Adineta ricciae]